MADYVLYHLPGACSRVTMAALEQCGVDYADHPVNLMKGEQHSPAFRAVNPRGKIPALVADGQVLAENAAIQWYLHRSFPEAGLFPDAASGWDEAQILSDLFWISSGWHPAVRANMMPIRWTTGDPAPVRARGKELVKPLFEALDARLANQPWWFGDSWSIIDVYACWNYSAAQEGEYDLSGLDNLAAHRARVEQRPAFQRALARENAARERMTNAA
jgi:glutathione S-transferase